MDTSYVLKELGSLCVTTVFVLYHVVESLVFAVIPTAWRTKKSINGQIAVVTGAGHGLGRELALRLARNGAVIVLLDINGQGNEETKKLIFAEGGTAYAYTCDVGDWQQVNDVARRIEQDVGNAKILVNNAGIVGSCERIINTPHEFIENTFRVNILSQFWTVKAFLPYMLQANNGHIVNIGSVLGFTGQDKLAPYCSTKHAVHGFHESLTWEVYALGKRGVKTTLIAPFAFASGMFSGISIKFDFLTPLLTTASVADRTMDAILLEEDFVVIPRVPALFCIVKSIFPWKAVMHGYEFFGATSSTAKLESKLPASARTVVMEPIPEDS